MKDIEEMSKIVMPRFSIGGRWFDDVVNNDLEIEGRNITKNEKPKCALLGQDGNIFNLMGIASKTLKRNNMKNEAEEMCERIKNSQSYSEALNIISDYVEIVSEEELEDEEEY